jgi:hypothetical protein
MCAVMLIRMYVCGYVDDVYTYLCGWVYVHICAYVCMAHVDMLYVYVCVCVHILCVWRMFVCVYVCLCA